MVVTQFLISDLPHPLNFSYFDIIAFITANLSNFILIKIDTTTYRTANLNQFRKKLFLGS